MAEIPVERKTAFPFWMIPAILIVLLAFGAIAYTMSRPEAESVNTVNVTEVERTETQSNTVDKTIDNTSQIVDVNVFAQTPEKTSLVGREVRLENVTVGRVLSDRVFTVVSGNTEFFALLDNQLDSAGGNEGRVVIKPNERRSFIGNFVKVTSADLREEQNSNLPLNSPEYQELKDQQVYLHITNLTN